MPKKLLEIDELLPILESTQENLSAATEGLSPEQLAQEPNEGEWSILVILAHLRSCADMWGERRIFGMMNEDHPTIRTTSPNTWWNHTNYREMDFHDSLVAFGKQRDALLAALKPLSPEQWQRTAAIVGAGKPFEVTIHIEGDALARHERSI